MRLRASENVAGRYRLQGTGKTACSASGQLRSVRREGFDDGSWREEYVAQSSSQRLRLPYSAMICGVSINNKERQ